MDLLLIIYVETNPKMINPIIVYMMLASFEPVCGKYPNGLSGVLLVAGGFDGV